MKSKLFKTKAQFTVFIIIIAAFVVTLIIDKYLSSLLGTKLKASLSLISSDRYYLLIAYYIIHPLCLFLGGAAIGFFVPAPGSASKAIKILLIVVGALLLIPGLGYIGFCFPLIYPLVRPFTVLLLVNRLRFRLFFYVFPILSGFIIAFAINSGYANKSCEKKQDETD